MALRGLKVIELAGLAPAPFCGSILADFGAQVTKVDKHIGNADLDSLSNGKKSVALNLKHPQGVAIFKKMSEQSDVLIEPFRRGVMEKLGLGPDVLMKANPKLIYARLTGYGQNGPMADRAGHDINYLATSGLLSLLGRSSEPPTPPINLMADFAGGGLMCAFGIVMALLERKRTGLGQIVDASMVEGSAYVGSWLFRGQHLPIWGQPRGQNMLDTGAHFYDTYQTKDGYYMAVGAIEPQFYAQLLQGLGLTEDLATQFPSSKEEAQKVRQTIAKCFASKTRDEWKSIFDKSDACVTPVLTLQEAMDHPHNKERKSFIKGVDGSIVPCPAPQLSHSPGTSAATQRRPQIGQHTEEVLQALGYSETLISELQKDGCIAISKKKSKL
ncbi:hypothetical protein B566_EDAN005997 [Ephemera danica]|nr:hypothetical protein B566_EDAN005997 [Ephemera danica]